MERTSFNDNYPGAQLGIMLLFSFAGIFLFASVAYLLAALIFGVDMAAMQNLGNMTDPKNVEIAKFIQLFLSTGLFVVVPLTLGFMFSGDSFSYLKINRNPSGAKLGWVIIIMIAAIPVINLIAELNAHIRLPGFMSSLEKVLMEKEKTNEGLTNAFLNVHSLPGFFYNLLLVAVIPAIGEEFFFRGILQRILTNLTRNYHWGIVLGGFVFSAIHMQFYGFFPRWLLGVMFGYMFVWSGSLWLPILAHFVNNSMAVAIAFLVNAKSVDSKMMEIGSTKDAWLLTTILTIVVGIGLYRLYKTRILLNAV